MSGGHLIAWDVESPGPRVEVGPHPDTTDWSDKYAQTSGWPFLRMYSLSEGGTGQRHYEGLPLCWFVTAYLFRTFCESLPRFRFWRDMGIALPEGMYPRCFRPGAYETIDPHSP